LIEVTTQEIMPIKSVMQKEQSQAANKGSNMIAVKSSTEASSNIMRSDKKNDVKGSLTRDRGYVSSIVEAEASPHYEVVRIDNIIPMKDLSNGINSLAIKK
jgi:hydrogenase maturation factor